jgi:hypothetical protein
MARWRAWLFWPWTVLVWTAAALFALAILGPLLAWPALTWFAVSPAAWISGEAWLAVVVAYAGFMFVRWARWRHDLRR